MKSGTLWTRIQQTTHTAIQKGALHPLPTTSQWVTQDGVQFLVRILPHFADKEQIFKSGSSVSSNPFLPFDQNLFIGDIGDTHVCLLNKFNVIDHHVLIVTRQFEEQETLLSPEDFSALFSCISEFDALGFYNSGRTAGASQRHKHLQMVPLPLVPTGPKIPLEPILSLTEKNAIATSLKFPFPHTISSLDASWFASPHIGAKKAFERYRIMVDALHLLQDGGQTGDIRPEPYNLLLSREWMWIVPRSQEKFQTISINALGFAGALLVKNEKEFHLVREVGPLTVLNQVAKTLKEDA